MSRFYRPSAKETLRHPYFKELRYFSLFFYTLCIIIHIFREAERRAKLRMKSDSVQPDLSMKQQQQQVRI